MAKDKASKEGNDIGVDLAGNIAKAISRVLSTYDFSPLNKNLVKGLGTVDVSSLLKSNNTKIRQLAADIKSSLEKGVGDMSVAPTLDIAPLEKAGDLVRTLINLTEQANKKTTITADLYNKITEAANKLVASKKIEKSAAEDIAKTYQAKLPPLKVKTEIEKIDISAIEAQTSKLKPVDLKASITTIDSSIIEKQLPTTELKAVVQSVDTKSIDDQVKKIDLIGLQALVTEVDTSLVQEEVSKLNPLSLTSQISAPDGKLFQEVADAQQESINLTEQQTQATNNLEASQQRVLAGRFDETKPLIDNINATKILAEMEESKIQPAKDFVKFLKEGKITYSQLKDVVGIVTGGQGELSRAYEDSNNALVTLLRVQDAINNSTTKAYENQVNVNSEKEFSNLLADKGVRYAMELLTEEQKLSTRENLSYKTALAATEKQRKAAEDLVGARSELLGLLNSEAAAHNLSIGAIDAINKALQDEENLIQSTAEAYGYKGKLLDYVTAQLEEGLTIEQVRGSAGYKSLELLQDETKKRSALLQSQAEGVNLAKELGKAESNQNALLRETLQHSNTFLFQQVDVEKVLQDQVDTRKHLLEIAERDGAAGEGARALLKSENELFSQRVDLAGHQGEAAAYVVEQLKNGRELTAIQNDETLKTLEAQQKSIDFRKKDLELQNLTKKRIEEIKKSHDGIKDRIKQTLDFSKQLAKDPKALGMFAAAQVGIGLHKANHAMHELVDSGMQAGEAVHVMADGISVMSVLGLSKVSGVNKELIAQFGTMNVLTKDQRHTIGEMATKFGLAEQEAVNLTMAISRMPGESADTATNFANTAKHVGKMSGVMPSQIMKEMAKNSGLMSTYSKGGAEGFAKAAAQAKKMGVELSSVLSAAEKTLDFENSINAQMEASLLIGKSMNFDKMRAAALSGDANAIMEEQAAIMQQVGSLDNMNVLQKKKLAEAMGLTVDELTKMNEAQQFQNKYFGENASAFDNVVGGVMKYGGAAVDFVAKNGMMILGVIQATTQIMALRAVKAANTAATLTDTTVTNANTTAQKLSATQLKAYQTLRAANIPAQQAMTMARNADTTSLGTNTGAQNLNQTVAKKGILTKIAERTQRLLGIATTTAETGSENLGALSKQKNTGLTSMQTLTENARRFGRMLGLGVTTTEIGLENASTATKGRGVIATLALNAATLVRNVVVGAGNLILGAANVLLSLFGVNTATAGTAGAGAAPGLVAFGIALGTAGAAAAPAIPIILAFGAAILLATPAIYVLGEVLKVVATVIGNVLMKALEMLPAIIGSVAAGFVTIFSTLAQNWQILIPVGVGLVTVAAGLTAMGAAGFFAYPGLLLAGLGLMAMVPGLTLINMLTQTGGVTALTTALVGLGAAGPGLALVGASLAVVAASLGGMAIAGLAAMPIIGALAGLATVAPMLAGLGNLFGGGEKQEGSTQTVTQTNTGGGDKEDKMSILIEEIRGLRSEMSKGGTINMDGKKVGDVLRLAMNTSGVR